MSAEWIYPTELLNCLLRMLRKKKIHFLLVNRQRRSEEEHILTWLAEFPSTPLLSLISIRAETAFICVSLLPNSIHQGKKTEPSHRLVSAAFVLAFKSCLMGDGTKGDAWWVHRADVKACGRRGRNLHRLPLNEGQANADLFCKFTRVVLLKVISAPPLRVINGNTETSVSL